MAMAVPMAKTSKHGENPRVMNLAKDVPGIRGLGEARVGVESPAKDGVEVGSGYKDTVEVESFGDGVGLQFTDIRYNQFSDRK